MFNEYSGGYIYKSKTLWIGSQKWKLTVNTVASWLVVMDSEKSTPILLQRNGYLRAVKEKTLWNGLVPCRYPANFGLFPHVVAPPPLGEHPNIPSWHIGHPSNWYNMYTWIVRCMFYRKFRGNFKPIYMVYLQAPCCQNIQRPCRIQVFPHKNCLLWRGSWMPFKARLRSFESQMYGTVNGH